MHAASSPRSDRTAIVGLFLVGLGIAAFVLRELGYDPLRAIADVDWPIFVIVPGLVLAAAAVFVERPTGIGFAIAGAIVTSVGLLLWYQNTTDHWESWAYAWALIGPGAAGLGLFLYGAWSHQPSQVATGLRLMGIAAVLFLAGMLFFETIFESGRLPIDLGDAWPILLVAIGVVIVLGALLGGGSRPSAGDEGAGGTHR
ncbi:MAG TPA: hypothetical protein VK194_06300 [Candidatus Deferrimicrobium sp.]|nr:hypothetical protein [Candidatus Deferrimicrobium sp.]